MTIQQQKWEFFTKKKKTKLKDSIDFNDSETQNSHDLNDSDGVTSPQG